MMTAEQLKNSILQLAMQGKLVEQRSSEGTGEELYKEIQAERKQFVKEGKIKKQKPLQGINEDDIPFDIPAHWIWTQIGDVTFMEAGGTPARTKSEYWNGNIPWVKIGDMHGKYTSVTEESITQKGLECSTAKVFTKGTVLYSIFASIGTVSILTIDAATNQAIVGISHTNAIGNEYLYYVLMGLKSVVIQKQHGMAQMNINQTILKEAPFPLPPLAEQKRIVAKIEELMPFVEQYAAASTKLNTLNASFPEMMKKSILQEAVQGKLVPQDPNDEPASLLLKKIAQKCIIPSELENEINDNYRYAHLVDACLGIYDCPHSTPTYSETFQGYLCLRTRELEVGEIEWGKLLYLTEDTYKERITRYRPKKGDIVYAREGRYGICAVIDRDTPLALGQRLMVFSVNHEILRSKYLFYVLISDFCLKQVTSAQRGMTAAHVNVKDIKKMIVPIPSLKTQDAVINVLDKLLNKIDLLKALTF